MQIKAWIPFPVGNASERGSRWCWPRNGNYAARRTHDPLDISHQIDLLELLSELNREKGYTTAAVLHDLNQACRYASHLIALREGKIVAQGAPKEIVTAELIERIYGLRCMIIDDPVAGTPLVVPLGRTAPSTANS